MRGMAGEWSRRHESRDSGTIRERREVQVRRSAARQRQLVRRDQLLSAGFTRNAVSQRVAVGTLFLVHRGVYALHSPPYTHEQGWLAAVYAGGPATLLSHWSAAALLGLTDAVPPLAAITNLTGRARGYPGIELHCACVHPRDRVGREGIPCTSAARTIVDVAPVANPCQLEGLILAADSLRLLNRARLAALLEERRGRAGTRKILSLIRDDPVDTRSESERRILSICREFGVPPPLVNHPVEVAGRTFCADLCWPELRLIVEVDSWRWHGARGAMEKDADRDQLLSVAGWRVVHFTRDQARLSRAETGRRLAALTAARTPRVVPTSRIS